MRKLNLVQESIAAIFVLLFLYTAISKLINYSGFVSAMAHSTLIGRFSNILAWMVPSMEIMTVFLLFIPKLRYAGLVASTALMTLFTGYTIVILSFSSTLPCTCGGVIERLSWKEHLAFNTVLLGLGVTGIYLYKVVIPITRRSRIPVR